MHEGRLPGPQPAPNGSSERGGQWLPLDAAPKDGTSVLAWSEEEKCFHTLAYDAHEPASWMAKNGEFLVQDPSRFRFWQPDPNTYDNPGRARDGRGRLRLVVAFAVAALIAIVAWLGGVWTENNFDLIP